MKDYYIVTHRGTSESIKGKLNHLFIKAYKPHTDSMILNKLGWGKKIARFIDGEDEVVWVSKGFPNFINKLFSGMIGKRGEAYIVFKIKKNMLKRPKSIKRIFLLSQFVIEGDVSLSKDCIICYKY